MYILIFHYLYIFILPFTCYSVRKKIDEIRCENLVLKDFKLDFGVIDPNDRVSGLIGLDFLIDAKSIIDLVDLTIYEKDI